MTSATAVNYFPTSEGHGFAWEHPNSPVNSIVIANDSSADWNRIQRTLYAMQKENFMAPEHSAEILSTLRSHTVANDNPQKSWVQRVSERSKSNLER